MGVAIALLATPRYEAEASFMPPTDGGSSSAAAMLAQFSGGLAGIGGSALGLKDPSQMYVGVIGSREIREKIVKQFGLDSVYRISDPDDLVNTLAGNTVVTAGKDGIIRISVTDRSPLRASQMANAYMDRLQECLNGYSLREANDRKTFFESQLTIVKERLWKAELELKDAQLKSGVMDPTGQATMTFTAIAELRARLAAKQIELRASAGTLMPSNPVVQQLHSEIAGIERELAKLKDGNSPDALVQASKLPEAIVAYYRAFREVKYQETLFEIISKQFELAKLDGERASTVLKVVDHAVAPSKRSFPKRSMMVVVFFVGSMVMAIVACYLLMLWDDVQVQYRKELEEAQASSKFLGKILSVVGKL